MCDRTQLSQSINCLFSLDTYDVIHCYDLSLKGSSLFWNITHFMKSSDAILWSVFRWVFIWNGSDFSNMILRMLYDIKSLEKSWLCFMFLPMLFLPHTSSDVDIWKFNTYTTSNTCNIKIWMFCFSFCTF